MADKQVDWIPSSPSYVLLDGVAEDQLVQSVFLVSFLFSSLPLLETVSQMLHVVHTINSSSTEKNWPIMVHVDHI